MIDLSHVLGLSVTAEGVETADQFALIANLGADDAQGFYSSKPLTPPKPTDYANNVACWRTLGLVP
jgi:EAL domain-containing protein (putative c-di-GMP-specific phosphodiesterase class I)